MYAFTPADIDAKRADYQAKQYVDDHSAERIGNLGEIAFERFSREYMPREMWQNEDAIRRCNPESYAGHDFEVSATKST